MKALLRVCLLMALAASPAGAAPLLVLGYGPNHADLDAAALAKLPSVEIDASDRGQVHHYHGVAVRDVLALVGAPTGEKMRGKAMLLAVRVTGADGYVVVFALAEFDPAFREQSILLVDSQDGKPLAPGSGPLRLVCPGDKRPARWARQVTSIEVVSVAPPAP